MHTHRIRYWGVGPCGILVKPNDREGLRDAIACVLDDRNLVERYTERASEFLAQFRGVHVLEQYEELLGKTAGSQRSR
jgi:glycosyltransferase involved in cell wall biosynthesis